MARGESGLRRVGWLLVYVGLLWLHVVAALIDNDVRGIFLLTYTPHLLAARIINAIGQLIGWVGLILLALCLFRWGVRKMARDARSSQ